MVATENWLKLSCTHSWSIKVARISSANTVSGLAFSSVLVLFLLIQHLSCRPPPLPLRWCPSIAVTIKAPVRSQQPSILHPRFDHSKCELSCAVVLCCVVLCVNDDNGVVVLSPILQPKCVTGHNVFY